MSNLLIQNKYVTCTIAPAARKAIKMSGCYGSSPEDKHFEQQLHNFLDSVYPPEEVVEDGDWYEENKIMEKNDE